MQWQRMCFLQQKVTDFEAWCAHLQLLISIHKLENSLLNIIKFDLSQLLSLIGKTLRWVRLNMRILKITEVGY